MPERLPRAAFRVRLSTRLTLIIALCLAPVVALQLVVSWSQWTERKAQLDNLAVQQAELLAGNVASIMGGARILLGAASEFLQVHTFGSGCAEGLAGLRRHAPEFLFVALLDATGQIRCTSEPALLNAEADASWARNARQAQTFTAGRFARSALHPGGFLPFHMPLSAGELPGGTLVAALDLAWLERHLRSLKRTGSPFLASGVLTISDADGVVLARDARHSEFVGRQFPPAAMSLVHASEPGVMRLRSMDGTDRVVGYTPPTQANHGLSAVVGFNEPDLMADIERTLLNGVLLLGVVSLLAFSLTLLVVRRFITHPTQDLLAVAREWREGDLTARAPEGDRRSEFGQIAAAWNAMAAALRRRDEELRCHAEVLEERVAERTRELRQINVQLQAEMAERRSTEAALLQAQKVQAVGQLAGGIAHDFNNVLQAVTGGIGLIRRRAGDRAAVERLAGMVEEAARRGASVTRRLLAFSRREELRPSALDAGALVGGLREVLSATLGARIRVQVEVEPNLPPVLADQSQLETVLVNLATNARDAMPDGGILTLSAHVYNVTDQGGPACLNAGSYVQLAVADTGEGMSADTLARASEPFFTTKPLGKGTGLGLAMARSFAKGSGGALAITSKPDQGTRVSVWLPVTDQKAGDCRDPAPTDRAPASGWGNRRARVLLVDDEPVVREVLTAELREAGYDVTESGDGEAALDLLEGGADFDILVTDLALPGMDGVALIRAAQGHQPGLRVILITGYAGDAAALAVGATVSGAFALLRKPVTAAQLTDRVAASLAAAPDRIERVFS
jgi:signal transduction histidine kinase/CheY-like chemotaxis protein